MAVQLTSAQAGAAASWPAALATAARALDEHGRLAVTGPWGSGKTSLVAQLTEARGAQAPTVLRISPADGDQELAFGAVAQLLAGCPAPLLDALPPSRAAVVDRLLHRSPEGPLPGGELPAARLTLAELLGTGGLLLVVDGAQWLDPASADLLGYALRTVPAERLRAVVTERGTGGAPTAARLLGGHPAEVRVPDLDLPETSALLSRHGLPTRWAALLHRQCGGHRLLTSLCCTALAQQPPSARGRPIVPPEAREAAETWLAALPGPVRSTLLAAALAHRPTPALLLRAGCEEAEEHLRQARRAGVLRAGPGVRFTATLLAEAASCTAGRAARSAVHRTLAAAVDDPVQVVRHRALGHQGGTERELAEDTEAAGETARQGGDRELAAELFLLAAELTPATGAGLRLRRLGSAAREAAVAGRTDLAWQVADTVSAARAGAEHQVPALLAVVDAHSQALAALDPLIARCRELAGADPGLLAAVELRAAIAANVTHGAPGEALGAAARAAELAHRSGQSGLEAAALTMRARMERVLGRDDAPATLGRALALAVPAHRFGVRNSAQYLAARHAVFDDRLPWAREQLTGLLAVAERHGDTEDLVDIWRSLAEVDTRLGRCPDALAGADRAVRVSVSAGLSLGPAWYTAALAQSVGGSFPAALRYAACGAGAAEEEGDALHLARNLWVLAAVRQHGGDSAGAAAGFAELARLEGGPAADPTMFRWQPDAIEAFAAAGRPDLARELLAQAGPAVEAHPGTAAAWSRARGVLLARTGAGEEAVAVLRRAADGFGGSGLPVEQARTLVACGRVERSRRRQAAARAAWEQAAGLLAEAGARPWLELTHELLARLNGTGAGSGTAPVDELTGTERRLAALVGGGASNRQAAQQLFVSVKTVEGTLSRIYRKLGIRSRTQLAAALAGRPS
ncbi:LuxR family transcriptional regulator [Kitasatospora sp. NBC_00070]|uniref:helix-turn-helix transcriptional regulator n=1 Tax=Kitasatospora sp. NBC_00070 TaxID=2975962 RepID=UPI00324E9786